MKGTTPADQSRHRGQERLKKPYRELPRLAQKILTRARPLAAARDPAAVAEWSQLIERTEQVRGTARRRVLKGETVPNADKLFSIFEPHTQLYQRGNAGEPIQFGRLVLVYEDAAGFITHHHVLPRDAADRDVVVEQTRIVQQRLGGQSEEASFDRGFHTPENQQQLATIVAHPCLPKLGKLRQKQQQSSVRFRQARQRHPGVESAIGTLQAGNGLERCRDHSELGFDRFVSLGVLGRNLQVLGKLLIAREASRSEAAHSLRQKTAA
jgi:hypothetical protein